MEVGSSIWTWWDGRCLQGDIPVMKAADHGPWLGNVAETATANVFMVKDDVVKTPVPNGTFLNGITRQRVIKLLRADGVEVEECTLSLQDFRRADEVFMAGNISKVTRVSRFDDVAYNSHALSDRALELYWRWAATGPSL